VFAVGGDRLLTSVAAGFGHLAYLVRSPPVPAARLTTTQRGRPRVDRGIRDPWSATAQPEPREVRRRASLDSGRPTGHRGASEERFLSRGVDLSAGLEDPLGPLSRPYIASARRPGDNPWGRVLGTPFFASETHRTRERVGLLTETSRLFKAFGLCDTRVEADASPLRAPRLIWSLTVSDGGLDGLSAVPRRWIRL
jgi:hypothetical protein